MVFLTLGILTIVISLMARIIKAEDEQAKTKYKKAERVANTKKDIALIVALDDWTTMRGSKVTYGGEYLVYLGGKPHRVKLKEKKGGEIEAEVDEEEYSLTKERAKKGEEQKLPTEKDGAKEVVKASLPGIIQKVSVTTGSEVKRGQVLLILESLKMENEIISPVDGTIKEVLVNEGEEVEDGQKLITMERR